MPNRRIENLTAKITGASTAETFDIYDDVAIHRYDTMADMKSDTNLKSGDTAKTLGYYSLNDGGGGIYTVVNSNSVGHCESISNSLYARLITGTEVNVRQFGAYGDGTHDDTNAIQNAIDYFEKGGTVRIPKGTYMFTTITMKLKIRLIGEGWGNTILSQINGTNSDGIIVPPNCCCGRISYMTVTALDNSSTSKGTGIYISEITGNKYTIGADLISRDVIEDSDDLSVTYKYLVIDHVYIRAFKNGIYLNKCKFAIMISNVFVYNCLEYGILDEGSTDNFFDTLYLERCGYGGLRTTGANNKWSNIKSIWNDQSDYAWDETEAGSDYSGRAFEHVNDNRAAVYVKGSRNSFTNVEAQDNAGHGFLVWGHGNTLVNCLADSNGYLRTYGGVGFIFMFGQQNSTIGCQVDNYAYGSVIDGVDRTNVVFQDYYVHGNNMKDCRYDIVSSYAVNKFPVSCEALTQGLQKGYTTVSVAANSTAEVQISFDAAYKSTLDYCFVATPMLWTEPNMVDFLVRNKAQTTATVRVRNNGTGTSTIGVSWLAIGKLANYHN